MLIVKIWAFMYSRKNLPDRNFFAQKMSLIRKMFSVKTFSGTFELIQNVFSLKEFIALFISELFLPFKRGAIPRPLDRGGTSVSTH
jgi:hypothetical protein